MESAEKQCFVAYIFENRQTREGSVYKNRKIWML